MVGGPLGGLTTSGTGWPLTRISIKPHWSSVVEYAPSLHPIVGERSELSSGPYNELQLLKIMEEIQHLSMDIDHLVEMLVEWESRSSNSLVKIGDFVIPADVFSPDNLAKFGAMPGVGNIPGLKDMKSGRGKPGFGGVPGSGGLGGVPGAGGMPASKHMMRVNGMAKARAINSPTALGAAKISSWRGMAKRPGNYNMGMSVISAPGRIRGFSGSV